MHFNFGAVPRKLNPEPDTPSAEELIEKCQPCIADLLTYYCTTPQKRKVLQLWNKIEEVVLDVGER